MVHKCESGPDRVKKNDLSRNVLGSVETAIFMRSGVQRFTKNETAMKKSFLVPFMALPLTLMMVLAAHPQDNLSLSTQAVLITIYTLRLFVYMGGFLGSVYLMAKAMDRLDGFSRFVTAHNWLALPLAIFMLPLVIMLVNGSHTWAEIQPMLSVVMLYSVAYLAFMATYVMRMPWELAGFVAILGLAVHQTSLDILKWVAVEAVYLVS